MLVPLFLASAALAAAGPTTPQHITKTRATEPCAEVASLTETATYLDAQLVYDCLQTVPVDVEGDKKLIEELKILWGWNSEYVELKNMPEDWEFGSLDIEAELNKIKDGLGDFKSEYDVQRAIQEITYKTGNYHFNYVPDILQVFDWGRSVGVVSISEDGKQLPKLYVDEDAFDLKSGNVSEISKINDVEAYEYLAKIGVWGQYIDSDGRLNKLFTKGDTKMRGTFESQVHYDGNSTKITYADGTERSFTNYATTLETFTDVVDGPSFFSKFCNGTSSGNFDADGEADTSIDPQGEPFKAKKKAPTANFIQKRQLSNASYTTVFALDDDSLSGYFLSGDGYSDIAVLKIYSFSPADESGTEFQQALKDFLAQCATEKKSKLIIDLRENGGGLANLVLDVFMQLFPEMEPFSAQRYRVDEQWNAIGEAINGIHEKSPSSSENLADRFRPWSYWHFVTAKGENFADWKSYVGPEAWYGDNFTATSRYNYSNSDDISIRPTGFYFLNGTRPTVFEAKNMVMFTDALCGSACAGIHEELKNIAGVRSVTVGGRPENRPIQAVTGSKGSEVNRVSRIPGYADIIDIAESYGVTPPTSQQLQNLGNVSQLLIRAGDSHTRIQTQDQLRKGDTTGTALEFIYEAADCKYFYTANTWDDTDAAWKQAWDAYQDDTKCVEGSTKHKTSISGGYVPYGPGKLDDKDIPKPNSTTNNPSNPSGTGAPTGTDKPKSAGASLKAGGAVFALVIATAMTML